MLEKTMGRKFKNISPHPNVDQCSLSLNNVFSLMWPETMKSFPQDWFGTARWPPFKAEATSCENALLIRRVRQNKIGVSFND